MKKNICSLATLILLLAACTKEIDLDLNDDKHSRLVVEGSITTEKKAHIIKLSRTSNYFANEPTPRETGATVKIFEEGSDDPFVFVETEQGVYKSDTSVFGKVGKNYTLEITLQDGEEYSATAFLDTVPDMDSVTYEYEEFNMNNKIFKYYILKLWAQEPEGEGDNYLFNIFINGIWDNDTLNEAVYDNDEYIDGMYIPGVDIYGIRDEDFEDDTITVRVDMLSIPEDLIEYNIAVMMETEWKGSPFDGPPANVPTNINNGALGFFSASDVSSYEFELVKQQ